MRRTACIAIFLIAAIGGVEAQTSHASGPSPFAILIDAGASGRIAATETVDTPLLSQLGYSARIDISYRGNEAALRLGLTLFRLLPSSISADGQLYRGWEGTRFSAETGIIRESKSSDLGLDILAGAALTASNYLDTSLIFAYPSVLAEARLVFGARRGYGFWIGIPLELAIRGRVLTPSIGLAAGIRLEAFSRGLR